MIYSREQAEKIYKHMRDGYIEFNGAIGGGHELDEFDKNVEEVFRILNGLTSRLIVCSKKADRVEALDEGSLTKLCGSCGLCSKEMVLWYSRSVLQGYWRVK